MRKKQYFVVHPTEINGVFSQYIYHYCQAELVEVLPNYPSTRVRAAVVAVTSLFLHR